MTARYVNPNSGTDSGGGAIGAPWRTLTYAVANAASGDTIELVANGASVEANWTFSSSSANGKSLSIYSTPGQKFTYTLSDTTRGILMTGSAWNGTSSFTISDMILTCATTVSNGIVETIGTGTGTTAFTFNNVTVQGSANDARCWYDNHAVSTLNFSYTWNNCTFNAQSLGGGVAVVNAQKPFDKIIFNACTLNFGTAGMNFGQSSGAGGNGVNEITLSSNTINCTGLNVGGSAFYYNFTNTNKCKNMRLVNNIVNTNRMAFDVQGAIKNLFISGNTITGSNQNILMLVGSDSNTGNLSIGYATVLNNMLTLTGTVSHGHFMGRNVSKGEYAYNTANGSDYGMVIKGNTKIFAHHNKSYNIKNGCLYVRGSQDSNISDNSFYRIGAGGHGSECFGIMVDSINDSGVYTDPARNEFKRNLIYIADGAPTGSYFAVSENDTSHAGVTSIADHVFDYNIIRQPSNQKWAKFNANTEYTLISDARTAWASYATVNYLNDANSQSADPKFISPTNLDIRRNSPAWGTSATMFHNAGAGGKRPAKANRGIYLRST